MPRVRGLLVPVGADVLPAASPARTISKSCDIPRLITLLVGEKEATELDEFTEFVSARGTHLFRTAYLLAGDRHLAEDLVQTTLGKLYAGWSGIDNPVAYGRTVLLRTFVAHRRRTGKEYPTDPLPDRHVTDGDPTLRIALFDALGQLSKRDRAIVVLRYWEDRSVEETASTLRLRSGVVRTQSMRALSQLRALLGNDVTELIERS